MLGLSFLNHKGALGFVHICQADAFPGPTSPGPPFVYFSLIKSSTTARPKNDKLHHHLAPQYKAHCVHNYTYVCVPRKLEFLVPGKGRRLWPNASVFSLEVSRLRHCLPRLPLAVDNSSSVVKGKLSAGPTWGGFRCVHLQEVLSKAQELPCRQHCMQLLLSFHHCLLNSPTLPRCLGARPPPLSELFLEMGIIVKLHGALSPSALPPPTPRRDDPTTTVTELGVGKVC